MRRLDDMTSGMALPVAILVAAFLAIALTIDDTTPLSGGETRAFGVGGEAGAWQAVPAR